MDTWHQLRSWRSCSSRDRSASDNDEMDAGQVGARHEKEVSLSLQYETVECFAQWLEFSGGEGCSWIDSLRCNDDAPAELGARQSQRKAGEKLTKAVREGAGAKRANSSMSLLDFRNDRSRSQSRMEVGLEESMRLSAVVQMF